MLNWLKNLFRSDAYRLAYSDLKTVFLIKEYKALGESTTYEAKAKKSDSGYYIEHYSNLFILRESGKLEPQSKDLRWLPKSGWTKEDLAKLNMVGNNKE